VPLLAVNKPIRLLDLDGVGDVRDDEIYELGCRMPESETGLHHRLFPIVKDAIGEERLFG
jgi:hypothetical protein